MKILKLFKTVLYIMIFLIFFIVGFLVFLSYGKADSEIIDTVSLSIDKIQEILIKNNYCNSKEDCDNKAYVLYDSAFNNIYLNIYNNVDRTTSNEICSMMKNIKLQNKHIDFYLEFFEYSKDEYYQGYNNNNQVIKQKAFYKCKY
ncbi:hypothetical protein AVANS14531_01725 [Campylobacter sp. Cr9]|uniref:hypothetical protein n=1 Tax=Campylobacter sp. Cr9 TaxID=2735728 RepID=UPI00301477DB|nr:hypothetical protein [Campylobacter sp. Cr9]